MQWNSINPPDSNRRVLVWEPASSQPYQIARYRRSSRLGEQWVDQYGEFIHVTHWAELPEAPAET